MTPQDPLDDQLRSYLRQRAAVKVPPRLVANALASAGRPPSRLRGWLRTAAASAALVLFFLTVGRQLVEPLFQPVGDGPPAIIIGVPTPAPTPSTAADTAAPSLTASGSPLARSPAASDDGLAAAGFPATVLGLPVISVADARALIADGGYQGRAMAVGGWWSAATFAMGCPAPAVFMSVIQGYCSQTALAPTNAKIDDYQHSGTSTSEGFQPPPDALIPGGGPETAGYDEPWKGVIPGSAERQQPQRVVLVGHVGDIRAWMCDADAYVSCRNEFVTDAFAWVEGRSINPWNDHVGGTWNLTLDQAAADVAAAAPASRLVTLSNGTVDEISFFDPRITPDARPFWLAHVITGATDSAGTALLTEVLIDDATGATRTLPMSYTPGMEPGTVQYIGLGDFFNGTGELPTVYAAILDGSGKRLQEADIFEMGNTPAVLPAGDYGVVSWTGDPESQLAYPSPPPRTGCSGRVHVTSDAIVSVTITWTAKLTCTIGPSPTPTATP